MNRVELTALWNFLTELNSDEIFEGVGTSDEANLFDNDTESSVDPVYWDESSVASFTSDDTNETMNSDDDMATGIANSPHTKNRPTTSKSKSPASVEKRRAKQKIYDKNWKERRRFRVATGTKVFVAGLKLLNGLLEDRIERTTRVSMTMRLVQVGKEDQKFSAFERGLQTVELEGKAQLALNLEAFKYIDLWTTTWTQTKDEYGKFFLRQTVPEIDFQIEGLVKLGEKLTESVKELDWCMRQKPTGVWV